MRAAVAFAVGGWSAVVAVWLSAHNGRDALWEMALSGLYIFTVVWLGVWVFGWIVSGPAEAVVQSERVAADQDYTWLHASHRRGRA